MLIYIPKGGVVMDGINHNDKNVIENIYALAKLKGITIKTLEERCDLGQGYLSRIKRQGDGTSMSVATVEKIAKELGCGMSSLMYGEYSVMNEEEMYYKMLIDKLKDDTNIGKLLWRNVDFQFDDNERKIVYPENIENHPLRAILNKVSIEEFTDKDGKKRCEGYGYNGYLSLFDDDPSEYLFCDLGYYCDLDMETKIYLFRSPDDYELGELIMAHNNKIYHLCGNIYKDNIYQNDICCLMDTVMTKIDLEPHLTEDIKKILDGYVYGGNRYKEEK